MGLRTLKTRMVGRRGAMISSFEGVSGEGKGGCGDTKPPIPNAIPITSETRENRSKSWTCNHRELTLPPIPI